MENSLFSIKGRIRRKDYWLRNIIGGFLLGCAWTVAIIYDFPIYLIVCWAFYSIFMLIQGVKRMHDTGNSGWFLLIPLYNFILTLTDGTVGENEYGEDPKGRQLITRNS